MYSWLGTMVTAVVLSVGSGPVAATEPMVWNGALTTDDLALTNGSYIDIYEVAGQAGDRITIELESDEFDAHLMVNYRQQAVASDHDSGSLNNALIAITLPADGTYQVGVQAQQTGSLGRYRLSWRPTTPRDLQRLEASRLSRDGRSLSRQFQYDAAIAAFQQARALYDTVGDRAEVGLTLSNLGTTYRNLGQYREALEHYREALALRLAIGDRAGEANTRLNLGALHHDLGQYREALDATEQALAIHQAVGNRRAEATALNNIGLAYDQLGGYQDAAMAYEAALAIQQDLGDRVAIGTTLNNLGGVSDALGDLPTAQQHYIAALTAHRLADDRAGEALAIGNLGTIDARRGQPRKALASYDIALEIHRETNDRANEARTLAKMGAAWRDLGELAQAEAALGQSLTVLESLERDLGRNDRDRVAFFDAFETQSTAYSTLTATAIEGGRLEVALEVTDRARARSLTDWLHAPGITAPRSPLTIAAMKQLARDQQAAIVVYALLENRVVTWVIAPDGRLNVRTTDPSTVGITLDRAIAGTRSAASSVLNDLLFGRTDSPFSSPWVQTVRSGIGDHSDGRSGGDPVPAIATTGADGLRQGYRLLIKPIEDLLPQGDRARAIIVPHRELGLLPFGALLDDTDTFLAERLAISVTPSLQVLDTVSRSTTRGQGILAIGDPAPMPQQNGTTLDPLAGAATEASTIAGFFNTTALLGSRATETAVKQRLTSSNILHFATHGIFQLRDRDGLDTWLALAPDPANHQDGKLTLTEIAERPLNAQLAVLSACDTGNGRVTSEGIIGLARAFLRAGTPTVVASLWKVPDRQTALLMEAFYRSLLAGNSPAVALQSAQLKVRASYPNPYYWAAFVLIGDGDRPLGPRDRARP